MGQWYHCVGQFHGDAGVKLEANRVRVWERTAERSQLAVRKTYSPKQGSYMSGKQLIEPDQVCLDFAYGQPKEVDKSPYPEKVLMAFYHNFTGEEALNFLTESAKEKLSTELNEWGDIAPWPRTSVTSLCVKELNYDPGAEVQAQITMVAQAEATHVAQATAEAVATLTACPSPECTCPPTPAETQVSPPVWVTTRVEYRLANESRTMRLTWGLVKVNGVWRIDQVIPLSE
jgi:hypothetical protein